MGVAEMEVAVMAEVARVEARGAKAPTEAGESASTSAQARVPAVPEGVHRGGQTATWLAGRTGAVSGWGPEKGFFFVKTLALATRCPSPPGI